MPMRSAVRGYLQYSVHFSPRVHTDAQKKSKGIAGHVSSESVPSVLWYVFLSRYADFEVRLVTRWKRVTCFAFHLVGMRIE